MLRPRITPCLLVHDGGLVKTTLFDEPKYVGDPINAVKIFNEKETDELIVLDIDASVRNAEPNFKLIAQLAVECRMPLCYGGRWSNQADDEHRWPAQIVDFGLLLSETRCPPMLPPRGGFAQVVVNIRCRRPLQNVARFPIIDLKIAYEALNLCRAPRQRSD